MNKLPVVRQIVQDKQQVVLSMSVIQAFRSTMSVEILAHMTSDRCE